MEKKKWYQKPTIIIIFIAVFGLGLYIFHFEFREPLLEVYFFHLDRGRSIFLRTPHGKTILIDGGQTSEIMRELTKIFPFYRRRIDTLIVTSSAPKNVGGLVEVATRYDIGKVIEPIVMGTSTALSAFEKTIQEKGLVIEKVGKGDGFTIDEVNFKVLFPDPTFKFNKTNTPELVLSVKYSGKDMLFLGDVSKTIQKSLIPEITKAHLVEYAHSASDSRVSSELFNKLDPNFIVITKKDSTRSPSKTKKKFDIETIDTSKLINLDKKGTVRLTF